jgi:hypothetical protein
MLPVKNVLRHGGPVAERIEFPVQRRCSDLAAGEQRFILVGKGEFFGQKSEKSSVSFPKA